MGYFKSEYTILPNFMADWFFYNDSAMEFGAIVWWLLTLWKNKYKKNLALLYCFQFKIRREAMSGLALIYKTHMNSMDVPQPTKKAMTWIKDRILHGYYLQGNEDR